MSTFIKLTQPQTLRLARLLHMEYTPRELAEEIQCSVQQIHRATEAGCPHRVTERRTWIVGDAFATWYQATIKARKRPLRRDEAFCLSCRQPVPLDETISTPVRDGVERVSGICPRCGNPVHRFRSAPRGER
jgi:hypothetical protein